MVWNTNWELFPFLLSASVVIPRIFEDIKLSLQNGNINESNHVPVKFYYVAVKKMIPKQCKIIV